MRFVALILALLLFSAPLIYAADKDVWSPLETLDESRQRHSAERWDYYQQQKQQNPVGLAPYSYPSDRLGDPAPYGTPKPGYVDPYGSNKVPRF